MALAPADPRHGTLNGYSNHDCRCDRCRAAQREYVRRHREHRRATTTCPNCGGPGGEYGDNMCHPCYEYQRRHGVPRPPEVYDPQPVRCRNCGVEAPPRKRSKGRCLTCARYLTRNGVERPARLWARAWLPKPPEPERLPAGARVRLSASTCWPERRGAVGTVVDPPTSRRHPQPGPGETLVLLTRDPMADAAGLERQHLRGWTCVVETDWLAVIP